MGPARVNINSYAPLLEQIGRSLAAEGDILLYGCKVGAGETRQSFVESMARITRTDVAASDDLTGASDLGGDWQLEVVSTSKVQAQPINIESWRGILQTATVTVTIVSTTPGVIGTYTDRHGDKVVLKSE